ncbi:hypothetical protein PWT90_01254 [Aphanocladium album]|nr:hypothetical protein PWT90_01254 [Aphanocladium album]
MSETGTSRLVDLPWEVRRPIIVDVLQSGRSKLPSFSPKLIKSRVRLRNCFDANFPEVTNFYVPRYKYRRLHGHGLRATNRQLRHETDLLVEEQLQSGRLEAPFVLDVMLVREIGVFQSWVSFPYIPEHIKKLVINLRIVRPEMTTVPDEWVEMASYRKREDAPTQITSWHLFMAITYYALGCFSVKQDPLLPRVQPDSQPATRQRELLAERERACTCAGPSVPARPENTSQKAITGTSPPIRTKLIKCKGTKCKQLPLRIPKKRGQWPKRMDIIAHQSDTFNAYRLSSASYVTDELFLNFARVEYDVNNEPVSLPAKINGKRPGPWNGIPPGVLETCQESRFYKEGYTQFSRDFFQDYSYYCMDLTDLDDDLQLIYEGQYFTAHLHEHSTENIYGLRSPKIYESRLALYLQVLAHSIGTITQAGPWKAWDHLIIQCPIEWLYSDVRWEDESEYTDQIIEQNLAKELARGSPDEEHILRLRIIQSRKAHGWINEGDILTHG